jgi:cation transport ATPase
VLINGGEHLEALGGVRAMAFDQTGTLTTGTPQVTDLMTTPAVTEPESLRVAAAVERRSRHPLAAAVVRPAEADGLALPEAVSARSLPPPTVNRWIGRDASRS